MLASDVSPMSTLAQTSELPAVYAAEAVSRYAERLLFVSAMAAAIVFAAVGMQRPVWLDEANSVIIASRGFAGVSSALALENNLPGYYYLLSIWIRLFGDSEIALRSLSALFYLGGCWTAFAIGRRIAGTRAGWYSAFFYECSSLAIKQAQNIRMYTMLGMLAGLSTLGMLRVIRDRARSWQAWALLIGADAAGIFTHAWFAFVLIAQFAAILLFERRQFWRFSAAVAASAVPFLVLWASRFVAQMHNGATDWMRWFQPSFLIFTPLEFYGPLAGLVLYMLAISSAGMAGRARCRRAMPGSGVWMMVVLFVISLAVPLAVSAYRPIYWPGRYTIIAVAPLAAAIGVVLSSLLPRPILAVVGLLLLGVQLPAYFERLGVAPDGRSAAGQSDKRTAEFLIANAGPGDAVVFTSLTRAAADYYIKRAGAADRFVEINFPEEVASHLGWENVKVPPERRPVLEAEASALAQRLAALGAKGSRIWVYDGFSPKVDEILRTNLAATLTVHREVPLEGPYHKRVVEYGLR